jgi:hypothetical protein
MPNSFHALKRLSVVAFRDIQGARFRMGDVVREKLRKALHIFWL